MDFMPWSDDMDKVEAARREIAELKKQIEEPQRRIAELEIFIRVADTIVIPSANGSSTTPRPASAPESESASKPQTFKDQVINLTEEMLAHTKWMKTRQIVDRLEQSGVTINTKSSKVVRISSILVKEKEKFSSSRKRGWTLRQGRIDSPKTKGPNARTFSPLTTTSRGGQPTLAALSSD